jgi:galactokinase
MHEDIGVFSTPGRTEICGNHTDHNAGYVLAAAVNLDIVSIAAKTNSNIIRVQSKDFGAYAVTFDQLEPDEREFYTSPALVRGVAARMKQLGHKIGGFDCYTISNVPNGVGLSSSAAFEVQICTILNHFYNVGTAVGDVANAQIAQYSENHFFGKPCGLMDQTTCAVGGLLQINFADFENPGIEKIQFDFASQKHMLYLVETGGNHADLNEDYIALEHEMKQTAKLLGAPVLRFTSRETFFKNIKTLRENENDRAILRAYHFYNESDRVQKQVQALKKDDFEEFKRLIIESGESSFMFCQNVYANTRWQEQCIAIALMIAEECLKSRGAWRVHGGGFSGTIQAFVPETIADKFAYCMTAAFGEGSCHKTMFRQKGTIRID